MRKVRRPRLPPGPTARTRSPRVRRPHRWRLRTECPAQVRMTSTSDARVRRTVATPPGGPPSPATVDRGLPGQLRAPIEHPAEISPLRGRRLGSSGGRTAALLFGDDSPSVRLRRVGGDRRARTCSFTWRRCRHPTCRTGSSASRLMSVTTRSMPGTVSSSPNAALKDPAGIDREAQVLEPPDPASSDAGCPR